MKLINSLKGVGPKMAWRVSRSQSMAGSWFKSTKVCLRAAANSHKAPEPSCRLYWRSTAHGSVTIPGKNGLSSTLNFSRRGKFTSFSTSLKWHNTSVRLHSPGVGWRVQSSGDNGLVMLNKAAGVAVRFNFTASGVEISVETLSVKFWLSQSMRSSSEPASVVGLVWEEPD